MFAERKFNEDADSLPNGEVVLRSQFTVTAKTNTGQIENLFDGSDSTYYESNSSGQCMLTFNFANPTMLSYLCMYRSSGDSNSPKEVTITAIFEGKELSLRIYSLNKKSKWAWFPMPYDLITRVILSVGSSHNSYSNSKFRKISFISGTPWFNPFSKTKHLRMLASDLLQNTENTIVLSSKLDSGFSVEVPKIATFLTVPSWLKGVKHTDKSFEVNQPGCILKGLEMFLKGDNISTLDYLYTIPNGTKSSDTGLPYIQKNVYNTLGGISVFYSIALKTNAKALSTFCEDSILQSSLFKIGKIIPSTDAAESNLEGSRVSVVDPKCVSWLCNCNEVFSRRVMKVMTDTTGGNNGQLGGLNKSQLEGILESLATK